MLSQQCSDRVWSVRQTVHYWVLIYAGIYKYKYICERNECALMLTIEEFQLTFIQIDTKKVIGSVMMMRGYSFIFFSSFFSKFAFCLLMLGLYESTVFIFLVWWLLLFFFPISITIIIVIAFEFLSFCFFCFC